MGGRPQPNFTEKELILIAELVKDLALDLSMEDSDYQLVSDLYTKLDIYLELVKE